MKQWRYMIIPDFRCCSMQIKTSWNKFKYKIKTINKFCTSSNWISSHLRNMILICFIPQKIIPRLLFIRKYSFVFPFQISRCCEKWYKKSWKRNSCWLNYNHQIYVFWLAINFHHRIRNVIKKSWGDDFTGLEKQKIVIDENLRKKCWFLILDNLNISLWASIRYIQLIHEKGRNFTLRKISKVAKPFGAHFYWILIKSSMIRWFLCRT